MLYESKGPTSRVVAIANNARHHFIHARNLSAFEHRPRTNPFLVRFDRNAQTYQRCQSRLARSNEKRRCSHGESLLSSART